MFKTFRPGGIHPSENKLTAGSKIRGLPIPGQVSIPMNQHIGASPKILVEKGDMVKVGQLIAQEEGFISANIHSSVSGKVLKVDAVVDMSGYKRKAITIKVEGDEWLEEIDTSTELVKEISLERHEIVRKINESGIVGMGGATFPSHVKLMLPRGKKAEYLIVNGAECEPYITCDHRLMLEDPESIIEGIKVVMKALGVKKTIIGIEDNKPDAIKILKKLLSKQKKISVGTLKSKYPQGAEKQLIYALTSRVVPSGGLPMDIGVVVLNVGTISSIANIFKTGLPVTERIVTVTGNGVNNPNNLLVRLGTSFEDCVNACDGLKDNVEKIISGGPMMGVAQSNLQATINEGTTAILVLDKKEAKVVHPENCIRCGSCIYACPIGLMPLSIAATADKGDFDLAEKLGAKDCIECGICTYICPSRRSLVQSIRLAKSILNKRRI
ncbi:MAG: electron transport complex subunit RsxC [Clostridiales bacterium]|nr:electron transport complex subunit RsxC [Clostridiales bacterium]